LESTLHEQLPPDEQLSDPGLREKAAAVAD
jgi:hypothetical protein